jgi:hypothetical protein
MGSEFLQGLGADIQRAFNEAGVKTDGLQMLQFEALLGTEQEARQVAQAFEQLGLTSKVGQFDDDQWSCSGTAPMEIDVGKLNDLGAKLQVVIEKDHAGEFNGWSLVAQWDDLRNPKAPALTIGQMRGMVDEAKFPHAVIARVLDTTEPTDRGQKYDDKLHSRLEQSGAGSMVAAGSYVQGGNVVGLRFEFRLANVDGAVATVKRVLADCGAPRGSWLEVAGKELPLFDDTAELLERSRRNAPTTPAPPSGSIPAASWLAVQGETDGMPAVWMINGGLLDLTPKEAFPWHLSIICELKEANDNGLPTSAENEAFKAIGQFFDDAISKSGNALPLARVTCDGAKQYVYRVRDPEIPHQWLQSVIASKTEPRAFEYEMKNDPGWDLAEQHMAIAAQARKGG